MSWIAPSEKRTTRSKSAFLEAAMATFMMVATIQSGTPLSTFNSQPTSVQHEGSGKIVHRGPGTVERLLERAPGAVE